MTAVLGEIRSGHFTSELLLGAERLAPAEKASYQAFFRAVVAQRGFPLHTASLWNALNFGWNLDLRSYQGRGVQHTLAESGPAIPIGSLVEVKAGSRILWAEVVYKEGRDPRVDEYGVAEAAVSGARLGRSRATEQVCVREGLVLDFDVFGEGINDVNGTVFERAARKGWLTSERHLEVEACYRRGEVGLDDLALFARHVHAQYGDTLFDEFLRDYGAGIGPDERWELLLSSIEAVADIALSTPGLRTFGDYHLDEAAYQGRLASHDGLFDAMAIRGLARTVANPGHRTRTSYTAVGPLIRERLRGSDGLDLEEAALLAGTGYARLVLETNVAIAERIGGAGLVDDVHIRLDDEDEHGGIWRATRCPGGPPPEARWHPLVPLGLGFASTSGVTPVESPISLAGAEEPIVERSDKGWTVTLRAIDLHYRDLPIPADVVGMIRDGPTVVVEINDGLEPTRRHAYQIDRERRFARKLHYPLSLFPGVIVRCSVGFGGGMITVRATPLPVPVEIEGRTLRLEFSERVFRAEVGLTAVEPETGGRDHVSSPTDQIATVFRRRGRPTGDGGRFLTSQEVVVAILGADFPPEASLPIVLALQAGDYEWRDGGYVWQPGPSRRTSPRERVKIHEMREAGRGVGRYLVPRRVPMRLRQYVVNQPSSHKIATYAEARIRYHATDRLPDVLPPGNSWVEPYELGSRGL
jgi:hypothetical protein